MKVVQLFAVLGMLNLTAVSFVAAQGDQQIFNEEIEENIDASIPRINVSKTVEYPTGGEPHFSKSYCEARQKFLEAIGSTTTTQGSLVYDSKVSKAFKVDKDVLKNQKALNLVQECEGDPYAKIPSIQKPNFKPEQLTMDVAFYQNLNDGILEEDRELIVLVSGVHGIEGPAGSAVQTMFIKEYIARNKVPRGKDILFMHAVNPFGFKYLRRFNHDNIDLNRAFRTEAAAKEFFSGNHISRSSDYNKIRSRVTGDPDTDSTMVGLNPDPRYIVPSHADRNHLLDRLLSRSFKLTLGSVVANLWSNFFDVSVAIRAIGQGQFVDPKGPYFGGKSEDRPQEVSAVEEVFKKYFNKGYQKVLVVDLHSGVGPRNVVNIMPSPKGSRADTPENIYLRSIFNDGKGVICETTNERNFLFDGKINFNTSGDLNSYVDDLVSPESNLVRPNVTATVVTAEWGTYESPGQFLSGTFSELWSGYFLIKENQGYFRGYQNENTIISELAWSKYFKSHLVDRFNVPEASTACLKDDIKKESECRSKHWQARVLEQSRCVFEGNIFKSR